MYPQILTSLFIVLLGIQAEAQHRVINYYSCAATLPTATELKEAGVHRIEVLDYLMGEGGVTSIWEVNDEGLITKYTDIDIPDSIEHVTTYVYDNQQRLVAKTAAFWSENKQTYDTSFYTASWLPSGTMIETVNNGSFHKVDTTYYIGGFRYVKVANKNETHDDCTLSDTLYYNPAQNPLSWSNTSTPPSTINWEYNELNQCVKRTQVEACSNFKFTETSTRTYLNGRVRKETVRITPLKSEKENVKKYNYFRNKGGFLIKVESTARRSDLFEVHLSVGYFK